MNNNPKKPLSKEELTARLNAIASDETPRVKHHGAMCYCPAVDPPPDRVFKCEACGCDIFSYNKLHEGIVDIVKEMTKLGYDAKVETMCDSCAEKVQDELYPMTEDIDSIIDRILMIHNLNHIFYFRFPDEVEYHRAIANRESQYEALLTLMKNKRICLDDYDKSSYTADEIDTLEFMTGIKIDD